MSSAAEQARPALDVVHAGARRKFEVGGQTAGVPARLRSKMDDQNVSV